MNNRQGVFNIVVSIILASVVLFLVLAWMNADGQLDIQAMSLSGYLISLEDGAGTVQFAVADGGDVTLSGAVDGISTLDADGAVTLNSTLDVDGNVSSGTGAFTVTDSLVVTGAADFDSTFNADGAATFNSTVDIDGNISSGTGSITMTDNVDITGTVNYGSNNMYPLGYASSGQEIVYGSTSLTQTQVVTTGITAISAGGCVLGQAPTAAGAYACYVVISGGNMTATVILSDTTTASSAATVYWWAAGTE